MDNLKFANEHSKTTYYFQVFQFITTFENDYPNYSHVEGFSEGELLECRRNAIKYYFDQQKAIDTKGTFFERKIAGYSENFKVGANAAHSIVLSLVECYDGEEIEHYILGESDEETDEGHVTEYLVSKDLGIDINKENEEMRM